MSRRASRSWRSRPRSTRPRWRAGSAFRSRHLASIGRIDLAIDGADEVERGTLDLIKGHGGALLREKIVAAASKRFIVVVDDEKLVDRLGERFPIPVEIVQFGWQATAAALEKLGDQARIAAERFGRTFVTDGGNFILDCPFARSRSRGNWSRRSTRRSGSSRTGCFSGAARPSSSPRRTGSRIMTPRAGENGVRRISARRHRCRRHAASRTTRS